MHYWISHLQSIPGTIAPPRDKIYPVRRQVAPTIYSGDYSNLKHNAEKKNARSAVTLNPLQSIPLRSVIQPLKMAEM